MIGLFMTKRIDEDMTPLYFYYLIHSFTLCALFIMRKDNEHAYDISVFMLMLTTLIFNIIEMVHFYKNMKEQYYYVIYITLFLLNVILSLYYIYCIPSSYRSNNQAIIPTSIEIINNVEESGQLSEPWSISDNIIPISSEYILVNESTNDSIVVDVKIINNE